MRPSGNHDLYESLLEDFSGLPKRKNANLDEYAVINVSPPVVPNPYLPTFRIFSYNVTGAENTFIDGHPPAMEKESKRKHGHRRGHRGNKASECQLESNRNGWKCQLNDTWYSDPDAPSRRNTLWTPLGYAQASRLFVVAAVYTDVLRFSISSLT